ncbi:synapse-associated protein of 47 kDa-like isoform X3 [Bombus affinis]|uniref:Synapse-associated protein of 47 kDa isoform X3 n=1 Tax=Bombus terrestris TaxID=30195 RepID=A0A9C6SUT0_BOMTE|nr:synapse-associated protein of 47 kDa isoform X3 [Bombus terrestris]XP_050581849.1 synapse-associated protein of 47 kDa-like isoform X3 [Bombus affinis]
MFTGLTNQVSTWMGKKGEDAGTELPTEEKLPTGTEGGEDPDRKDSPTRSMLVGVKSQMTGWFSGGIPGLSRGAGQGADGESQAGKPMNGAQMAQNTESTVAEQTKDDDASSWTNLSEAVSTVPRATGGADSGPASLEGSPSEDKEGQQAFGGVSTKALAGAKTLGGFLYSAVNKAGKTVVEAGVKIKKTVEENRLVAELNKEQEAFIANKHTEKGEAVAPWVGAPNEDILREECLSLSTDQRNFLKSPPKEVDFPWDFEAVQPMAQATLALDPNLENMRFQLVPKVISEENFWRNYFYRVSVLRQSHELNTMANQTENNLNQTSAGTVDQPEEEDWERELEAELKDYEVVTGNEERNSNATPIRNSGALDKDDWEKQIDELLANEDDEDLK